MPTLSRSGRFGLLFLLMPLLVQAQIDPRLLTAIRQNNPAGVQTALKAGANPNATDSLGATPLMWACFKADTAVVKLLVQRGAKTECRGIISADTSSYYGSLTGLAAGLNKLPLLRYLLETLKLPINGPEFNPETGKNDGWTPVEWAAFNGHLAILTYLAERGADLKVTNDNALVLALDQKKAPVAGFLIYKGLRLQPTHPDYKKYSERYLGLIGVMSREYNKKGRYDLAAYFAELRRAIYAQTVSQTDGLYAVMVNDIAVLERGMGHYDKALSLGLEALGICERAVGKETRTYVSILAGLSTVYDNLDRYDKSLETCKEALSIGGRVFGNIHPSYALLCNNMAHSYEQKGEYDKALPLYIECKTIQERVGLKRDPDYTSTLNNLAVLYDKMGQFDKALPLFLDCLKIQEEILGKQHFLYVTTLHNLASLYNEMGKSDEALKLYKEVLAVIKNSNLGQDHYATTLADIASQYKGRGLHTEADSLLKESQRIREAVLGKEHTAYVNSLLKRAYFYKEDGQYDKALSLLQESLTVSEKFQGKMHPDYIAIQVRLATLYKGRRQYQPALELYLEALKNTEKVLGKWHPDYAEIQYELADLYEETREFKKAASLLIETRQQYKNQLLKNSTILSEKALIQFQLQFDRKDFTYSLARQTRDVSLIDQSYNDLLLSKGIGLMAGQQFNRLLGQIKDTATVRLLTRHRDTQELLNRQLTVPLRQQRGVDSLQRLSDGLEQQLVMRLPEYRESFNVLKMEWPEVQRALGNDEAAIEFVVYDFYHNKYAPGIRGIVYAALVLRPGYRHPKFIHLGKEGDLDELLITDTESPAQINDLYRGGVAERGNDKTQLARGRALSRLIWQPLDSLLQGVKTVYVSPAGRLHQIALAALPYPADTNQRMADRFQIREVGSTRVVALRNAQIERPFAEKSFKTSLYGGITYDANKGRSSSQKIDQSIDNKIVKAWDYLPGTQIEIDALRRLLPPAHTTFLNREAATEGSVKALSGRAPSVLHIATHGFFFPPPPVPQNVIEIPPGDNITIDVRELSEKARKEREAAKRLADASDDRSRFQFSENPLLRSGLVMAGANYVWKGGTPIEGVDDGILTAYELSNLNLRGTELVVLSACETGLGQVRGSEGVYGLQRAVKMAGARYLLMSLWRVSDQETAEYMTLFYGQLLKKGSVPAAYDYAQSQMRTRHPKEPFKWAAFVLVE
ncbi:tetratricopeptide repeat protein [Larkinella punicea]|uniref:CHAT domain-containing protein n=1 Tax=Larkinella punicea TaxID=2315727 RepID=A0A368JGJ6_9BACT|nr:tetratricopeptide repeat protein [Larkinella punicea]RCR66385.1 CHAT domain-containing protein [Larkinella punicea]